MGQQIKQKFCFFNLTAPETEKKLIFPDAKGALKLYEEIKRRDARLYKYMHS